MIKVAIRGDTTELHIFVSAQELHELANEIDLLGTVSAQRGWQVDIDEPILISFFDDQQPTTAGDPDA